MAHLDQGSDNPFGITVGLGTVDLGELLADTVSVASLYESMAVSAFIRFTVVGVGNTCLDNRG